MGLFDIFKKKKEVEINHQEQKDEVQEISEEYDYDLGSLDITPNAPKKPPTLSYEESVKKLAEVDEKRNKEIEEGKKYQDELFSRADALYNSPAQQELSHRASKEAGILIDQAKQSQLFDKVTNFNKKYEDIDVLFSKTRRQFKMVDDKYILDDMFQQLLDLDNYKTIPDDYFKYAYLEKKNQEGLLDNREQNLYYEIKSNYTEPALESLYSKCILGYAALGYTKMAEELINSLPNQENKNTVLNAIDGIRNNIKNELENSQNKSK